MGIFDALTTAVSGLQAESFSLQNISGNIANSSTIGYKGINTTFEDLIPDATSPAEQVAGGVTAFAQQTITTQGTNTATTVATNMAIVGNGFFDVQIPTGTVDNQPVFSGITDYTQRGDFQVNANGNLVNGAGYYLMGVPVDPTTGNPVGNVPQVLQFQNNFVPAQATSQISYAANLPATPVTTASASAPAGTLLAAGGLDPANFTAGYNPLVIGTPAVPFGSGSVTGSVENDASAAAITAATPLANLSSLYANNDTITVDAATLNKTITFSTAQTTTTVNGAGDVTIGIGAGSTATVQTVLTAIDGITGTATPSTVAGGQITLQSGTADDLTVTSSNASAFAALGFTGTVQAIRTGGGTVGTGEVIGNDVPTFNNESISGGAVTGYNSAGSPVNIELRWAKTNSTATGGVDTWNLFYQTDPSATGTTAAWVNVGTNFTFGPSGTLTSPTNGTVTIPNVTVSGASLGTVSLSLGSSQLTQYASTGGTATINGITQNGYAAGQLQSLAINNNGIVVGTFSNGQNIDLAEVTLSHFNGTNFLQALDGGAYAATQESGAAIAGSTATITGSSVEGSNADIADEFTKLIVTQQAYSANTKVITTANDMVQDLLNVLR
jgi:flagellar hook protein FlgE